jgi:cytochrome c oxidase cbb3-type subunit III
VNNPNDMGKHGSEPNAPRGEAQADGAPLLSDHSYDGIQEYDNPTPGWWHLIFLATLMFCFPYVIIYHFNPDVADVPKRLQRVVDGYTEAQFKKLGKLELDEPTIQRAMNEPKWLSVGANVFRANCASCHASEGQGSIGANLTDESYINVKTLMDVPKVVIEGAKAGAMPAWRGKLNQNELVLVSAYVASLRGKNLPGRAPEGGVIPKWPAAPAAPAEAAGPRASR